jgi:hypothetical protein
MSDEPIKPTTAAQVELRGQDMHEKRASELRSIIEQLQSPISADKIRKLRPLRRSESVNCGWNWNIVEPRSSI